MLGREALFLAARAEDGRGEPTVLVEIVRSHFELPSAERGRGRCTTGACATARLGELAPAVVAAAGDGDAGRAARSSNGSPSEIVLMVRRALRDLELEDGRRRRSAAGCSQAARPARTSRGGGAAAAPERVRSCPMTPPVAGAALAALDAVGASERARSGAAAAEELRAPLRCACFADADDARGGRSPREVVDATAAPGPFLLGCPGGRSLRTTYRALARSDADRPARRS